MIACVCPLAAALEDTVTTLQFACRAKAIRNHAKINVQVRSIVTGSGAQLSPTTHPLLASSSSFSLQVSGDVVAKSVLTQYEAQLNTLRTQLAAAEAAAKEATQALGGGAGGGGGEGGSLREQSAQSGEERSAAEAALAQCVREYAKERAQKARLQQQISALQKRLLQTQITELQNTVLIGGRQIDPSASPSLASAAADDDLLTPGAADDAPPTEKLRAERRKTDRLDGRVRALTGRVHEQAAG